MAQGAGSDYADSERSRRHRISTRKCPDLASEDTANILAVQARAIQVSQWAEATGLYIPCAGACCE